MKKNIKIAITGTESTGKTILSEQLTQHYNAELVTEFARDYLKNKTNHYTYDDIVYIAKKQIEAEQKATASDKEIIICDTDSINIKIWLEYYNYKVPDFLLKHIASKPYNLSLLLYPNTLWINDGLRQNQSDRLSLYHQFEKHLNKFSYNYQIIDKLENKRFLQAIQKINNFININ